MACWTVDSAVVSASLTVTGGGNSRRELIMKRSNAATKHLFLAMNPSIEELFFGLFRHIKIGDRACVSLGCHGNAFGQCGMWMDS